MRILLVAPCFPPYPSSASLRTHGFARAWNAAGHDVTVLTTRKAADHRLMPLDSSGLDVVELPVSVSPPLRWLRRSTRTLDHGVAGEAPGEVPPGKDEGRSPAGRTIPLVTRLQALRESSGAFSSVRMPDLTDRWVGPAEAWARRRAAEMGPWDLMVTSCGPYTAHLVGLRLRSGAGRGNAAAARSWIADYRDLWTDNELFRGVPLLRRRERCLEDRCLATADAVTTATDGLAEILRERTNAPVSVVYNGFDPTEMDGLDRAKVFPPDGLVRLVFTGRLYERRQDPGPLMAAIAQLRRESPSLGERLRVTVAGLDATPWIRAAAEYGLPDLIEPLGWVPRSTSLRLQRDADAIVHVEWNDRHAGVLTAKLFEYMAAGPPVLVIGGDPKGEGPIAALVRETRTGVVLGREPASIAAELQRLVGSEDAALSRPARAADGRLAGFQRSRQALRMLSIAVPGTSDALPTRNESSVEGIAPRSNPPLVRPCPTTAS